MRRLLAFGLVTAFSAVSLADDDAACWYANLERVDHVTNPPVEGDNKFFTGEARNPAIFLAMMSHKGMRQLPYTLAEIRLAARTNPYVQHANEAGCNNPLLNSLQYSFAGENESLGGTYKPSVNYPNPDNTYSADPKAKIAVFSNSSYYRYLEWGHQSGTQYPLNQVCDVMSGSRRDECRQCLQTRGYYINPDVGLHYDKTNPSDTGRAAVFAGRWLNFYPPRHILLRVAMKRLNNEPEFQRMRIAVIGQNSAAGGHMIRNFQPSCSGQGGAVNPFNNAMESIAFDQTANPIAETLFNAGQFISNRGRYYGSPVNGVPSLFNSNAVLKSGFDEEPGNNMSMCNACNQHYVVLFSDGRNDVATPHCTRTLFGLGPLPAECAVENQCSANGMGPEGDGDDFIPAALTSSAFPTPQTPAGTCSKDYADDVSRFLATTDLNSKANFPGVQNLTTFTVGVGPASAPRLKILQQIAAEAGAHYHSATDFTTLMEAIRETFREILKRSTSFSVAAITTVQTRGTTYAFVPRFRPDNNNLWEGHLFRFKIFNEFAAGCTANDHNATTPEQLARNPNKDGDCDDVYLMDKYDRFIAEEPVNGDFVLVDTSKPFDHTLGSWPLLNKGTASAPIYTPAVPVWDAAGELAARDSTDERMIYSALDLDGNGVIEPHEQLRFNAANASQFKKALALGGADGEFCTSLKAKLAISGTFTEDDCAAYVINWVNGIDVFDEDGDGERTDRRTRKVLGDIFHSSPILVTPPTPQYLCDLGVSNQCVFSLYSNSLTPNGAAAYEAYRTEKSSRDQFVLVGSNDGMVHAFQAGTQKSGDDPETPGKEADSHLFYDLGTGRELWAFVPPDLLPKLKRLISGGRHEIFVDGTAMVRDIWVDSDLNPGKKDASEFRTIAIFGERQGGRHYFAIDVTEPSTPAFRWSWPLPGSREALEMGETWNDYAPNAPPIGPVAVADSSGPLTIGGTKAREVYAVFLNGGYDQSLVRGRSVNVLNAWTGKTMWRFARSLAGTNDPQQGLFPVASPVAMLDLGQAGNALDRPDGLFDTAVVGDVGGQVWTMRFFNPGKQGAMSSYDPNTNYQFDNWFGARTFAQFDGSSLANRSPFFHMPAAATIGTSGAVRVYLGSGDRKNIRETGGGVCSTGNLHACVRKGCTVDVNPSMSTSNLPATSGQSNDIGSVFARGGWRHNAGASTLAAERSKVGGGPASACSDKVRVRHSVTMTCGSTTRTNTFGLECPGGTTGINDSCSYEEPWVHDTIERTAATTNSRFYSLLLFSGANRPAFNQLSEARTYDQNALTDATLAQPDAATPSFATDTSAGFVVPYTRQDEATASGTGILAGCVIWNTLEPHAGSVDSTNGCSVAIPKNDGRTYHAHFVTGSTSCGVLTGDRSTVARTTIVPPPPPTPVVAINAETGEVRYSMISLEPGSPPSQTSVGQGDPLGTIYWLEVPREQHQCRHETGICN